MTYTVLGIDPGSIRAGFGVIAIHDEERLATWGSLQPGTKQDPIPDRLALLWRQLNNQLDEYQPDVLAIETVFIGQNRHTGMLLARTQGLAITAAALRGLPVHEYAASQVKATVCRKGNATKAQLRRALAGHLDPAIGKASDDASDALAIAYCHLLRSQGQRASQPKLDTDKFGVN